MSSAPQRIQLSRTRGWRMPENTVKVDRTTKWGNPFKATNVCITPSKVHKLGEPIGQAGAVIAFRNGLLFGLKRQPAKTLEQLEKLRGKNLACWCKPGDPCHADVLLELANLPRMTVEELRKRAESLARGARHE